MQSLLNELVQKVSEIDSNINLVETETHFASILYKYSIKYKYSENETNNTSYYIDIFLSIKRLEGLSKITLDGYELELSIFSKHINKPITAITSNDVRIFLSQFDHLKQSSVGRKISILKSFFQTMIDEEVIIKNPMSKIKTPKKEKRLPKSLSEEQIEVLRDNCKTIKEKAMFEFFLATGCRLNEVSQLNKNDINWNNLSVKVIGKGNVERVVYFNTKTAHRLKKYLNSRKDACDALFITDRREYRRLTNRGIQRIFDKIGQRSSINLHPHILRHCCANNLLNRGANLSLVQEILGHSSSDTTQIYCQLSEQNKYEGYRKYSV